MRDSEVTRVLRAPLPDVEALLTPETIVSAEGSHEPRDSSAENGTVVVTARPSGRLLAPQYVFESTDGHIRYRREGAASPLVAVETTIELEDRNETTEIRLRSIVDPAVPLPFLGRFVAWRRRRALEKICDGLAADLARQRTGE